MSLSKLTLSARQQLVEEKAALTLNHIKRSSFDVESVVGRNCENVIGVAQLPIGVAGPIKLKVKSEKLKVEEEKELYIPLATTEGALVASVSRGCKATRECGGIKVFVEEVGPTRGPYIRLNHLNDGFKIVDWIRGHWAAVQKISQGSEIHLRLNDWQWQLIGRTLYLRFVFHTEEAMGMNMVTIATEKILSHLAKKFDIKNYSVTGNVCTDKKPTAINRWFGRGKKVWAEAVLPREVVQKVLKSSPEEVVEVVHYKQHLGSIAVGSLGFNAHFANIIGALYIATGQDPSHIVEGSLGITTAELEGKDLYFSIHLPAVMVGTVGGGTWLPTQREALAILGFKERPESGDAIRLAGIVGAAVLAGELSLSTALAAGHLGKAHQALGRKK